MAKPPTPTSYSWYAPPQASLLRTPLLSAAAITVPRYGRDPPDRRPPGLVRSPPFPERPDRPLYPKFFCRPGPTWFPWSMLNDRRDTPPTLFHLPFPPHLSSRPQHPSQDRVLYFLKDFSLSFSRGISFPSYACTKFLSTLLDPPPVRATLTLSSQ